MIRTTDNFAGLRPSCRVPHLSLHLPPEWVSEALCAQTDPELFFPDVGGTVEPARRVCVACPVLAEFCDYALEVSGELHGVWGGLSADQRRRLRSNARRTGTPVTELADRHGRAA